MSSFSKELIQETIDCFQEENNVMLSPEEAEEYLGSFADLFLAFADKTACPASCEAGGRSATPEGVRGVSNTS